jgi:hypothetical protein
MSFRASFRAIWALKLFLSCFLLNSSQSNIACVEHEIPGEMSAERICRIFPGNTWISLGGGGGIQGKVRNFSIKPMSWHWDDVYATDTSSYIFFYQARRLSITKSHDLTRKCTHCLETVGTAKIVHDWDNLLTTWLHIKL